MQGQAFRGLGVIWKGVGLRGWGVWGELGAALAPRSEVEAGTALREMCQRRISYIALKSRSVLAWRLGVNAPNLAEILGFIA